MIVVTDRLSKGVIADGIENLEAETVAKWFMRRYYPYHFLPFAIVSDRGTQFTGALWTRICEVLHIQRRLSTAFTPETDGSTERMNQPIEAFLRQFVDHFQTDWVQLLPMAVSAICGRNAASTGVSPFFLTHGWEQTLFEDFADTLTDGEQRLSPVAKADFILRQLKDATQWAQAAMASAQESQEKAANLTRMQAPSYEVGEPVWLSLENIKTNRPCKKLDSKYAKFTVTEVVGSHSYRLNTPPGIHNVFHTRLLRPVKGNPLPGQVVTDQQPPALLVDGNEEYEVERIYDQKGKKVLRYLVQWKGYTHSTWEPRDALLNTTALQTWEQSLRSVADRKGGKRPARKRRTV